MNDVTDEPLVTIAVPCFNSGATLDEAVRSALAQTWPRVEVIVVNDGSTEPLTLTALENLPEDIRVVHQDNHGLPHARNTAIAAGTGTFVLPLDADDVIEPVYVAEAVQAMQADPALGIVYCYADLFGARSGPFDLPDFSIDRIIMENCIFNSAMFRRADWERVGGYDGRLRRGREDHDMWLSIIELGRTVRRLDGCYYHYRISSGSLNTNYAREDLVAIHAHLLRKHRQLYLDHAEGVFEHVFRQQDRINDLQLRYGRLESLIDRFPGAYDLLRRARRSRLRPARSVRRT